MIRKNYLPAKSLDLMFLIPYSKNQIKKRGFSLPSPTGQEPRDRVKLPPEGPGGRADLLRQPLTSSGRAVLSQAHHPHIGAQPWPHHQATLTHPVELIHTHILRQMT